MKHLLLVCLLIMTLTACQQHSSGLQVGDAMPSVALTNFQGNAVKLPDEFKGKVTLIHFWSIDCHFCDKEVLIALEPLYAKYKPQGFIPIAINESRVDQNDERLKRFEKLTYPLLVDEYGLIAKQFGVIGLPTTFVFDSTGVLREKVTGEAGMEEYEKRLITVLTRRSL